MALQLQVVHGGRIGSCLLKKGFIDIDGLANALSRHTGAPAAKLKHFDQVDAETLALLPAAVAIKHHAIPLARTARNGKEILVAFRDPLDVAAIDEIAFVCGARVHAFVAPELLIHRYLERYYDARPEAEFPSARGPMKRVALPNPVVAPREGAPSSAVPSLASAPAAGPMAPSAETPIDPLLIPQRSALRGSSPPVPTRAAPGIPHPSTWMSSVSGEAPRVVDERRSAEEPRPPPGVPLAAAVEFIEFREDGTSWPQAGAKEGALPEPLAAQGAQAAITVRNGQPAPQLLEPEVRLPRVLDPAPGGSEPAGVAARDAALREAREARDAALREAILRETREAAPVESPSPATGTRDLLPIGTRDFLPIGTRDLKPIEAPAREPGAAAIPPELALTPFAEPAKAASHEPLFSDDVPKTVAGPPLPRDFDAPRADESSASAPEAEPMTTADMDILAASPTPEPVILDAPIEAMLVPTRPALTLEDALTELARAPTRDDVGAIVIDFLKSTFGAGILFIVRDEVAFGWLGYSPGLEPSAIESIVLPLASPSPLSQAWARKAVFRGAPSESSSAISAHFFKTLRVSETPVEVVVAPIMVRDRIVNLIYAHAFDAGTIPDLAIPDLTRVARAASEAFVRVIKKRKDAVEPQATKPSSAG